MRRRAALCVLVALMAGQQAVAGIDRSPLPRLRPDVAAPVRYLPKRLPVFGPSVDTVRPRPRPSFAPPGGQAAVRASSMTQVPTARSLPPRARPSVVPQRAAAVSSQPARVLSAAQGAVCGDKSIRGAALAPIPGKIKGCGVSKPVRVTAVDGVALSQPATMDCDTAKALKRWVNKGVKPTVGRLGGGVESLQVIAHYSCRTRNNRPGAKISEHGRGKAVDIAAINLSNGSSLVVLDDWGRGAEGKLLRRMHEKACGPFGTVLGPKSDKYHQNHFHLDTARYRSGPYCR
ncbi:extensin-like domain-containing protein [Actibacterium sp. D379-3]